MFDDDSSEFNYSANDALYGASDTDTIVDSASEQAKQTAEHEEPFANLQTHRKAERKEPFANLQTNQKRMEDLATMADLAYKNPEQYAKTKELYQNFVEGQLPGYETAAYFLEIIKEVDAALNKLQETQKSNTTSENITTPQAVSSAKTAEEQKREDDKEGFKKLLKENPEKFAKAKEAYAEGTKNEATKESAEYYLGIINEIEKDNKLKKMMQKDAQNAGIVTEKASKQIENGGQFTQPNVAQQVAENNSKKVAFSRDAEGNPVYTLSGYGPRPSNGNGATDALYDGVYTVKANGQAVSYKSADGKIESTAWDASKKTAQALAQESKTHGATPMQMQHRIYS